MSHPDAVADEEEIPLLGGDVTEGVVRVGNTVRRPAKPTSPAIQSLLRHLEAAGFDGAPVALGYDSRGRETLSYVDGDSPGRPHPAYAVTDEALASVARLLRRFHEAAAGFVPPPDAVWHLPPQNVPGTPPPAPDVPELVGHRDITPENVVFRDGAAYALIDFDLAGPTTRVLEVVNTLRYWAPFRAPQDRDPSWTDVDAAARARIFCDAYGLSFEDRPVLVDRAELGLARSWHLMKAAAERDGGGWARMWEEGVGDVLLRASAWLAAEKPRLVATLTT